MDLVLARCLSKQVPSSATKPSVIFHASRISDGSVNINIALS